MAIVGKLIALFTITTYVSAQQYSNNYDPSSYLPQNYEPQRTLSVPELIKTERQQAPEISLKLELPREETPLIPFYNPQPSTELKAPIDYPIPSEELSIPKELKWNPENNPNYYYGSNENNPIQYPKKYIKIYEKDKPSSTGNLKNIDLPKFEKILYNLSKNENRANLQKEKVKKYPTHKINNNKKLSLNNNQQQSSTKGRKITKNSPKISTPLNGEGIDANVEATGFTNYDTPSSPLLLENHNHEFSSSLNDSPSSSQSGGERLEFQMHGYKGPHSYKWGYDTGKGYNRHFRFEERDKDGLVKGQYGYYDKHGKLHVINYHAHPHEGFHAEGNNGHF